MKKKSLSAKKKIHKKLLNYLKKPLINRIYQKYEETAPRTPQRPKDPLRVPE